MALDIMISALKKYLTKTNFLLFLILLLAAFLRFYRIGDYMTFLGDEGRDVLTVYNILHGHLTLLGPTSSVGGFFLGPIYYYFMAPFLWLFNYNPVGPAVMIALLGIITVYLVYYLGKNIFNKTTGFIAAFIYAISPLVVIYSKSSWNPNPMPFFTILCLWFLYRSLFEGKNKWVILSGICYGILLQLHYIETFLGVSIILYVIGAEFIFSINSGPARMMKKILKQVQDDIKIFFFFILGFLIGFSPYLAFEVRHKFVNTLNIINFIFHSPDVGGSGNILMKTWDVFITVFGKTLFYYPPSNTAVSTFGKLDIFAILISIVSLGSLIYFLIEFVSLLKQKGRDSSLTLRMTNKNKFLKYFLIFAWLIPPLLIFGFYKKNIYDYYFEFLYPVVILVISNFIGFLWKNNWKRTRFFANAQNNKLYQVINISSKIGGILILGAIIFTSIYYSPIRILPNEQVNQARLISKVVLNEVDNKPFNLALITGGNSDFAYRYFLTIWGHPPVTIQPPYLDPQRTSVTNQLIVICESIPCYPLGNPLFEIAGFGQAEIVDKKNVSFIEIYKLEHYQGKK